MIRDPRALFRPVGRHRTTPAPVGVMPTAFRLCPNELQQRAAYTHPDGSATCAECMAHIERSQP